MAAIGGTFTVNLNFKEVAMPVWEIVATVSEERGNETCRSDMSRVVFDEKIAAKSAVHAAFLAGAAALESKTGPVTEVIVRPFVAG